MKDYKACGYSAIGKSHEDKGIKCQDYCFFKRGDGFVVAAVADGLSSCKHSDIASHIAAEYSVDHCLKNIDINDSVEIILSKISNAFDEALFSIKQRGKDSLNDYDTTLTLAVFIEDIIYYGQIGDSGIIALTEEGKFERVTEAQNGEGIGKDRPVYPLAAKSKWVFKKYIHKVKALFLATDGVLKIIEPPILENQRYKINHGYLAYVFNTIDSKESEEEASLWIKSEVSKMPPEEVDFDDKTLLFINSNKGHLQKQLNEYYEYPTNEIWTSLMKKHKEELYSRNPLIEQPITETTIVHQKNKNGKIDQHEIPSKTEECQHHEQIKIASNISQNNSSYKKKVDKLIIASIAEFALIMAMVVFILLDNMPSLLVDYRFIFLIIAFCILYVGLAIVIIIEIMRLSK